MATVINNPNSGSGSAGGWIVAAVLIIVIALIALFVWPGFGRGGAAPAAPTQVNVEIPSPDMGGAMAP